MYAHRLIVPLQPGTQCTLCSALAVTLFVHFDQSSGDVSRLDVVCDVHAHALEVAAAL